MNAILANFSLFLGQKRGKLGGNGLLLLILSVVKIRTNFLNLLFTLLVVHTLGYISNKFLNLKAMKLSRVLFLCFYVSMFLC